MATSGGRDPLATLDLKSCVRMFNDVWGLCYLCTVSPLTLGILVKYFAERVNYYRCISPKVVSAPGGHTPPRVPTSTTPTTEDRENRQSFIVSKTVTVLGCQHSDDPKTKKNKTLTCQPNLLPFLVRCVCKRKLLQFLSSRCHVQERRK